MRLSKIVVTERKNFVTEQVLQSPALKVKEVQELLAAKYGHKMHPTELLKIMKAARGEPTVAVEAAGPFTPPTAPAEPTVAVFDAPAEPQTSGVVEIDDTGCDVN